MIVATPVPTAVPKPAPTAGPVAPPAAGAPFTGAPPAAAPKDDDAAAATAAAGAPGAPKPPAGEDAPIPTREQAIAETMSMSAHDAVAAVASNFDTLGKLTVGGGTKEGADHAKLASMLLSNSSNMVQLAHLKATEHLRSLADELDLRIISTATNLAAMGGQVALAGGSPTPVKIAEFAGAEVGKTVTAMKELLAIIDPKPVGGGAAPDVAPAPDIAPAPDAAPTPDAKTVPVPSAPNGNTGVAGAVPPTGLQHVTPGPGAGRGPNPA